MDPFLLGCTCTPGAAWVARTCPVHGPDRPSRTIINGDARDVLATWPSDSVDLIVTDPPYKKISGGNAAEGRPTGILAANDGKLFANNDIKFEEYLPDLYRVLKSPGHLYLFTDFTNLHEAMRQVWEAGFEIHNLLVWKKNNATPNRWYMKNVEYVIFARKGPARTIYEPGSMTCVEVPSVRDRLHPTEKPVELLRRYVVNSSKPGDLVLDPFCGSGSTGIAAAGRRFVGIEIDPEYAQIARESLA